MKDKTTPTTFVCSATQEPKELSKIENSWA